MTWPRDEAKLERVRALMAERGLDALVVRAPDNVLYLTNFWGMKGYDAVVFPREGEPALICLEASARRRRAHRLDGGLRLFPGYDERDPRPPALRALQLAAAVASSTGASRSSSARHPGVRPHGRRAHDVPAAWFDAFPGAEDATPLLVDARSLKTPQEIERMRLANDIAAAAMEHVQGVIAPGHDRGADRRGLAGLRARRGHGLGGQGRAGAGVLAVWSGPAIRTFTATSNRPVVEGEPTLFEIWVCADGYWCDHTKNLVPGEL